MFLPDMVKLLDRLGVRRSKDGIPAQEERVQGGVGGSACAVHEAPSSSLVLPAGCFVVPYHNASIYGKKMRDVHIAGFSVESDAVIRFRSSDGKVVITDLLVGVGMYANVKEAHDAMSLMFGNQDKMIARLESLEVDEKLLENEV